MNTSKLSIKLAIVVTSAIFFSQCNEYQNDMNGQQQKSVRPSIFNVNVGAKIPTETALRWIAKSGGIAGKKNSYSLSYKNASELVQAEGRLGVALHHAKAPSGQHKILAIGITAGVGFWESSPIINTTTRENMSNRTAIDWANAYITENPNGVQYHFFGRTILEQTLPHDLKITPAIDDAGKPQLLLSYYDEATGTEVFFDETTPCPPICPGL